MRSMLTFTLLVCALFCINATAFPFLSNSTAETRCGWFVNPTPANAWLLDAHGEWIISVQGGYQAEGDWPEFKDSQWVKTNINYGYGCACMKVNVNKSEEKVINIISAYAKPLSACRKDKALKGKEPKE